MEQHSFIDFPSVGRVRLTRLSVNTVHAEVSPLGVPIAHAMVS